MKWKFVTVQKLVQSARKSEQEKTEDEYLYPIQGSEILEVCQTQQQHQISLTGRNGILPFLYADPDSKQIMR